MVYPRQHLVDVITGANPMIIGKHLSEGQVQPASVDCSLGNVAYAMKSSALPRPGETVEQLIEKYARYDFVLTEHKINQLERGTCYLVPLRERISLADEAFAVFSPKSSTGRCDLWVRVVADRHSEFDRLPHGYRGRIYLEIHPLSFHVGICEGLELTQIRLKAVGHRWLKDADIARLHSGEGILFDKYGRMVPNNELNLRNGLRFHIDLDRDIVGFQARKAIDPIDLTKVSAHEWEDYWIPIKRPKHGEFVIEHDQFYLFSTKEKVRIPASVCGEIPPYDTGSGEFRSHYAGFFDNGFGSETGNTGVLEVRGREAPFRLVDGQPICKMEFEETTEVPNKLYDGNYQNTGPSLSKHFKDRFEAWGN